MKRLLMIAAVLVFPASVWAQVPVQRVPPVPPVPPVPVVAPLPRTPIAPQPVTAVWAEPFLADLGQVTVASQEALDRARIAMEDSRVHLESMKFDMEFAHAFDMQNAFPVTSSGSAYESGVSLLSRRDYERAIARFDQVIGQKGVRIDAALYHKAYALYRLGRSTDATAALATLKKDHPRSAYLKDANVLESAVRQSAGQPARPEQADDDELKLLALNALQHTDPERALPLLEGVLNGANSLQLKQRAIFVLAQSTQPRARQILMDLAKGAGNPDLQRYAIRYVASGGKRGATSAELREIYESTQDVDVKKAVLQAWGQSGDVASLVWVAGSNADLDLRRSAVSQISNEGAVQELWGIYQKEQNRDLKITILSRLGSLGAADRLSDVIRTESDVEIRRQAIRSLGRMRADKSGALLADLYSREADLDNKKAIISALSSQTNGEALVAIARKESNMTLKRDIVSRLSNMPKNKAAMDYMLEIIK
jgi:HEAT repeat protein